MPNLVIVSSHPIDVDSIESLPQSYILDFFALLFSQHMTSDVVFYHIAYRLSEYTLHQGHVPWKCTDTVVDGTAWNGMNKFPMFRGTPQIYDFTRCNESDVQHSHD